MDAGMMFLKPKLPRIIILVCFVLAIAFYFRLISQSGFYFDDYTLLYEYNWSFAGVAEEFAGMQRIVTRTLYWGVLSKIFGGNDTYYYLFNFATTLTTSFLIYKLCRHLSLTTLQSYTVALIYLISYPIILSMGWISAFQHLGAHLFMVLYALTYFAKSSISSAIYTFVIGLLGLFSNALFTPVALVMPVVSYLRTKELNVRFFVYFFIAFCSVVQGVHFSLIDGGYESKLNLDIVHINAVFYFSFGLGYVFAYFVLFLLAFVLVFSLIKKAWSIFFLIVVLVGLSAILLMLSHARQVYYFGPHIVLMVIIGILSMPQEWRNMFSLSALQFVFLVSIPIYEEAVVYPKGREIKKVSVEINDLLDEYGKPLCFYHFNGKFSLDQVDKTIEPGLWGLSFEGLKFTTARIKEFDTHSELVKYTSRNFLTPVQSPQCSSEAENYLHVAIYVQNLGRVHAFKPIVLAVN